MGAIGYPSLAVNRKKMVMSKLLLAFVATLLISVLSGCGNPNAEPVRAVSLSDTPQGSFALRSPQDGLYRIHDLRAEAENGGFVVSGHIGPASRMAEARSGHVDVRVISPDGTAITRASRSLDPVITSPRVFAERHFCVSVTGEPPSGTEVDVACHPGPALCHAGQ